MGKATCAAAGAEPGLEAARNEVLNETIRDEATRDLLAWIDSRICLTDPSATPAGRG